MAGGPWPPQGNAATSLAAGGYGLKFDGTDLIVLYQGTTVFSWKTSDQSAHTGTANNSSLGPLSASTLTLGGKVLFVANIATAGLGIPAIYASSSATGLIAADTNRINYTPPATAGRYRISWTIDTTTATTDNFTVVVTWKNATGTARSQNSGGFDKNGTALVAGAITNTIGAGAYYGSMLLDIDNSATAITLSTAGTFTTVTYNIAAWLEQVA
jgi:hypothetical protein